TTACPVAPPTDPPPARTPPAPRCRASGRRDAMPETSRPATVTLCLSAAEGPRPIRQIERIVMADIATSTAPQPHGAPDETMAAIAEDRKSTRLNSSHVKISYAVFC